MKNILIINTIGFGFEGMSSVIVNYISHMDRTGFQFDFIVQPGLNEKFAEILGSLGRLVCIPNRKKDLKMYLFGLKGQLKENPYDVVHIHGNSGTMFLEAALARRAGVRNVIAHCHSTKCSNRLMNAVLKFPMKWMAHELLACSDASGKWLYGNSDHTVLKNAIDIEKYRYREDVRCRMRKEYGWENCFVIGHVGYFSEGKNQKFLVQLLSELYAGDRSVRLLLIGWGEDRPEVVEEIDRLGLQNVVIRTGEITNTQDFYQAMDLFAMPSKWEGLPLAALEAQAAGLPVILSQNITKEAVCTETAGRLSLEAGPKGWAEEILAIRRFMPDRNRDVRTPLKEAGFDIESEADKLKAIYSAR